MKTRRAQTSVGASPVLVGAVTVLIAIIAVFIAYNANSGLPFVPTYDVKAELPTGAKLVKGNEVRVGGFRVGVVEDIRPEVVGSRASARSIAVVELKLDKTIEPLPADTRAARAPALGARPQVRGADAGHEPQELRARATRSRSRRPPSRSSSRTCSPPSTARRGRTSGRPPRASATPSPGAAAR